MDRRRHRRRRPLLLRKQNRQRFLGSEHAARVVAAFGDDLHLVVGGELLLDVLGEGLAPGAARGTLRHGWARAVETSQRQDIDFAQQVGSGARCQLLLQLIVALLGGVTGPALQSVRPVVVGSAVAAVAENPESGGVFARGARVVKIRIARRGGYHANYSCGLDASF